MTNIAAAFDKIAPVYDDLWTRSAVGLAQRAAVWHVVDGLFRSGDHVLDLGCGTGEDALHLRARGVRVTAVDASAEMVRAATIRGVDDVQQLAIEDLGELHGIYDGALSDFGVFNCIEDPRRVASALARLIRPGGRVAICVMGRLCLWETMHYLGRGEPHKAFRRWRGSSVWGKSTVFYPSVRELAAAFHPGFELSSWTGVGIFVPPSYVTGFSGGSIERLSRFDRLASAWPLVRAASDHRLLVFTRI